MTKKIWTPEAIREKIVTDNRMVERSIVKLFEYQTAAEQATEQTQDHNGVGFNGVDASILSSFAKQIIHQMHSGVRPEGRRLSERQLVIARKKLMKYARQLAGLVNKDYAPKAVQLSL